MVRVLIHVEGQTEETFVREVLNPFLVKKGFACVEARLVGRARNRGRRGGICGWGTVRKGILNHLKQDRNCFVTTMVDYYGLPKNGNDAWPGREGAQNLPFSERALAVERALHEDVCREMGSSFDGRRFIPFVVMHEFEALLFSDCAAFSQSIGQSEICSSLQSIRNQFNTPEEINDNLETSPSHRIEELVKGYQKPLFGAIAAIAIEVDVISRECPHFREWISNLESLLCIN